MTNAPTASNSNMTRGITRITMISDHAPMVITRLSGWIDVGKGKATIPRWMIPTKHNPVHSGRV